jgi:hypothetical protein
MKKKSIWIMLMMSILVCLIAVGCDLDTVNTEKEDGGTSNTDSTDTDGKTTEQQLIDRANQTLNYLKDRNFEQLALVVHKNKGVKFVTDASYGVEKEGKTFTADQVKTLKLTDKFYWGESDFEGEINLSVDDYFTKYVYSRDFIKEGEIGVDTVSRPGSGAPNFDKAFPGSRFVEYHFVGDSNNYMDWGVLWLVFEEVDEQWMLVCVMDNYWIP